MLEETTQAFVISDLTIIPLVIRRFLDRLLEMSVGKILAWYILPMKHSHVAKNLKKIESVHVTLLEFLLSLTRHQIKTAILIAIHKKTCAIKKKRRLWRLDHQGTTVNFRCVLCMSSGVTSDTRGNFGRSVTAIFKML